MQDQFYSLIDLPAGLDQPPHGILWEGRDKHLAPTRDTPLKRAVLGRTNNALSLIIAASMIWAAKRLSLKGDVTKVLRVAEATLCWQASPRYFNDDSPYFFGDPGLGLVERITETVAAKGTTDFQRAPGRHHPLPPLQDVADMVALTRHVLGERFDPAYKDWLRGLIDRLGGVAPRPGAPDDVWPELGTADYATRLSGVVGQPLPPEAANMARPFDPGERAALYSAFLRQVDWASNPYLNPPDKMKALGFDAEPYQ